jgi:hypothetical protein
MAKRSEAELRQRQTPRGLVTHAREYLSAAKIVAASAGFDDAHGGLKRRGLHHPYYFLAGHSIELSLKAMLLADGLTHARLKKIGHDLEKAWRCARNISANASRRELFDAYEDDLKLLNIHYREKDLEYRMTGYFSLPFARNLLEGAREFVLAADQVVSAI